ncbi:MAG TPA: hypothetical protein VLU43_04280 [Anaeromyxobacteraceae bacterium]|nr:hypothetical protein [Anaeromyxobacteraceae bacterium]
MSLEITTVPIRVEAAPTLSIPSMGDLVRVAVRFLTTAVVVTVGSILTLFAVVAATVLAPVLAVWAFRAAARHDRRLASST